MILANLAIPAALVAAIDGSSNINFPKRAEQVTTLRTYKAIPEKIDPAHILTMADTELSNALSTTLVSFNDDRGLISALAERWSVSGREVRFTLRNGLKWSDGTAALASQYKTALLRAKRLYESDLKALFDHVEAIEAPDDRTLVFSTKGPAAESGIVLKLSEPMYGLVALDPKGELDLKKSVGPYYLKARSHDQLTLAVNANWINFAPGVPEVIEMRQVDQSTGTPGNFMNERWANLVSGHSILDEKAMSSFKAQGFHIWQRNFDRLFALFPSKKFAADGGAEALKYLATKLDRSEMMKGLTGFSNAEQFFPRGYILWSQAGAKMKKTARPSSLGKIRLIALDRYKTLSFIPRLVKIMEELGAHVSLEFIKVTDLNARMKAQDYDLLASGVAVADPNFEGAISFWVEKDYAGIPSGPAPFDFAQQSRQARMLHSSRERAESMKGILIRAQEAGYVLPLFHFSSLSVSRPEVDLSSIPNTDETIDFSKVRIKK